MRAIVFVLATAILSILSVSVRKGTTFSVPRGPPEWLRRESFEGVLSGGWGDLHRLRTGWGYRVKGAEVEKIAKATSRSNSVDLASLCFASAEMEKCHLHSAIGYIAPADKMAGRERVIFAQRDRKLEAARERRRAARAASRPAIGSPMGRCLSGSAALRWRMAWAEGSAPWRHDPRTKTEGGRHDAALVFPFGIGTKAANRRHLISSSAVLVSRTQFLDFTLNHSRAETAKSTVATSRSSSMGQTGLRDGPGAMHAVGFSGELEDDRTVHQPVQTCRYQRRVLQVSGPRFEIDIGRQGG
jgi:hypothetical protein